MYSVSAHTVNGSYYFSSFHAHFLLPVVDHFKFIYDDHNSGKEKPKYMDQMYLRIYQSRSF